MTRIIMALLFQMSSSDFAVVIIFLSPSLVNICIIRSQNDVNELSPKHPIILINWKQPHARCSCSSWMLFSHKDGSSQHHHQNILRLPRSQNTFHFLFFFFCHRRVLDRLRRKRKMSFKNKLRPAQRRPVVATRYCSPGRQNPTDAHSS